MSLYIRAHDDFSYEIIYVHKGMFSKSRLHILINPGKHIKLPGQHLDHDHDVEINIKSLTHIVSMDTSVQNPKMIDRTIRLAERTNKPIITNEETAVHFREHGLSVKQLRIIGFETEVVDGLQIDPVYLEELSDQITEPEPPENIIIDMGKKIINTFNPLNWKPIKSIKNTIVEENREIIDTAKPLGFQLFFGSKIGVLLPLDRRGVNNLNRIIPQMNPRIVVIPNKEIGYTKQLRAGTARVIILNGEIEGDELIVVPQTYNPKIPHDTYYGSLAEWIEIDST
jgi:hypothetical protein